MKQKSQPEKIADYEDKAARWLGDANEQAERGNTVKAERLYQKAQYWLDRATKARNWH